MDNIFAEDNPGVRAVSLNETSVSPKFGLVWHFNDAWSLFGGYARGFRSPPYNDVNIGFTNVQFGYTAVANPDLKPETGDVVAWRDWRFEVTRRDGLRIDQVHARKATDATAATGAA